MNIPENIIQVVADAAFETVKATHLVSPKAGYDYADARLAVIQHALNNPALAPFLAALPATKATSPAETEPAAQVPLGPEDVKPGSVFRNAEVCWYNVKYVLDNCVCIDISGGNTLYYEELKTERWQINTSIPDTGRWDANAWRPCSKPEK